MNNAYILKVFIIASIFIQILQLLEIRYIMEGKWPFIKTATKKSRLLWLEMATMLQAMLIGVFFPTTFEATMIPFLIAFFLIWYTVFEKSFLPIKFLNLD